MYKSLTSNCASRRRINENYVKNQVGRGEPDDSLVNCDNKTNHCNRYVSDALLSGQNRSKLSIDDESSHPINGASTNNKTERKRNINMLDDEEVKTGDGMGDGGEVRDSMKRIKVEENVDGQDNNKRKMYQVSRWKIFRFLYFLVPRLLCGIRNVFNRDGVYSNDAPEINF